MAVGLTDIGVATTNNRNTQVIVPGNPKGIVVGSYNADLAWIEDNAAALRAAIA